MGPYEIVAPIGAGGMGEVYRARDERLKRDVAVKVLPAELAADPERRSRFEREARAASALSHPNILTVYDIGTHDSTVYIAMELVEGGTLKDLVASGPVPVKKLLEISVQIAEGLAAAHAAGIVHRDLKPQNVMITSGGRVKIVDFGLAKPLKIAEGERPLISTSEMISADLGARTVIGTYAYLSPEQASGRELDPRSDVFAFGIILYQMVARRFAVSGRHPHGGPREDQTAPDDACQRARDSRRQWIGIHLEDLSHDGAPVSALRAGSSRHFLQLARPASATSHLGRE